MVDATVHVIDRGSLECDLNYMMEGHTLGTHDEPNPETDYGEIPVWNLVIDHPEGPILREIGSHHDALDGHTPGLTGTVIHLDERTLVFTGDQVYQTPNFEEEIPLGAGLLWGKRPWFESLRRIEELQRRHDAEVVYGHDPEQFEAIREGWGA